MKISLGKMIGRSVAMILVTIFAVAAMLASNTRWLSNSQDSQSADPPPTREVRLRAVPVSVQRLEKETVEITDVYSGMIHPFERYSFAFEIAGRVEELGTSDRGTDLDEGDVVHAGDTLAVLDRRALLANVQQANARKEQAEADYDAAEQLRRRNPGAISETELRSDRTDMLVAKAESALAQKNLDDATLTATIDGVVSRREVNLGESVNPQQTVFEIVQVDQVLLIVGVPESRVTALVARQRELARRRKEVERAAQLGQPSPYQEEDLQFPVYVDLIGRGALRQRQSVRRGEVYRIGQTADDRTGLFQVEILLPNDDALLRPGLVAIATIVVDRVQAFRLPSSSAMFVDDRTYLFSLESIESDVNLPSRQAGDEADYRAFRWELQRDNYVEQESELIIFSLPPQQRTVVVRGHRRLVDGRPVKVIPDHEADEAPEASAADEVRTAEADS